MKQTTIGGQTVYLMNYEPNWNDPVDCEFKILSDLERGLTGKEDRTPLSMSLRASLSYKAHALREDLASLNNSLKALANAPVLCPFWPATSGYADSDKDGVSAGYFVAWEPDWGTWEIYVAGGSPASFTPSAHAKKAPLLWGRFDSALAPTAVTDELEEFDVEFIDNSSIDNALTVDVQTFVTGPSSHLVFPFQPNWAEPVEAGQTRYEIVKDEVGYGRETADTYYEQEGARIMAQTFACKDWGEFKKMLRFFFDMMGKVGRFWLPMAVAGCRLLSVDGLTLNVDNALAFANETHIALIQSGSASAFTIDTIDEEANTITVTEALDRTYIPSRTTLSPLVLSRFDSDTISASFKTDSLAVVDAEFSEVPKEVSGSDSGPEEIVAYLYKFDLSNHPTTYFTSFEQDLTYNTHTYTADKFTHSNVKESVNLEQTDIEITSRYSTSNPLRFFRPFKLEAPLYLTIYQVTLNTSAVVQSAATIFYGQVKSAKFDGPMITASCTGIGGLFDRMCPNMLMQPTCNYAVYSVPCGLDEDDWEMTAQVVEYPHAGSTYKMLINAPSFALADPRPTRPASLTIIEHYLAGGRFESGTGTTEESRSILDSDHTTYAPNIVITLRNPLENVPIVGATVHMWPGCDGRRETCLDYNASTNPDGKFDNFENFGGFPFIPLGNPTLTKINKDYSQGGKK